jgi:hypothetical protein
MANLNSASDIADTLSAPLGRLIAAVGQGLAEAQQGLDESTIATLKSLYGEDGNLLAAIDYQPTWYKIPEVEAELSIALSISGNIEKNGNATGIQLLAAPTDANFTNKYDYNVNASSTIRFKIVAVPPSPQAANLIFMPNFVDQPYNKVLTFLEERQIAYEIRDQQLNPLEKDNISLTDTTKVSITTPTAGEIIPSGAVVTVEIL